MSIFDSLLPIDALNSIPQSIDNAVLGALGLGVAKSNAAEKSKFTIKDFKGEVLGKGLAEESRFEVFIGVPNCLLGSSPWGKYMQGSLLRIESVQFPALSLHVKQRKIFGPSHPVPVGMDYGGEQGITITFVMDRDMKTKSMFDAWMDSIVPFETQTLAYPADYKTDMMISQLDKSDGSVYMAVVEDVFPRVVSAMNGNANGKDFQRVQVTFAYRKWSSRDVQSYKTAAASAASNLVSQGGSALQSITNQVQSRATALQGIAQKYGLSASISGISL